MYVSLMFWDSSLQTTVVFISDNIPCQSCFKPLFQSKAKCSGGSSPGPYFWTKLRPQGPMFLRPPPPLPPYLKVWIHHWSVTLLMWKWYVILMQVKFIFTRKVSHLASFRKWEVLELSNGLLLHWRKPVFMPALSPDTLDHFSGQNWVNLSLNAFAHSLHPLVAFYTHFHHRRFSCHVLSVSSAKASGNCPFLLSAVAFIIPQHWFPL